ncbi:MAG: hypothetical protein A2W91_17200 [Bacteroidetes bacterium GWF2_38_335]|nr:MAG: hypothetical protein A2W91_17200 [Bacteroidetes bacterium GWF2_38_335]OFY81420.1 MAG: hypothetical protein A2281_08175 [Bacteroidetes bacterium RIFOXYA12_FULL_38_20]HBS85547.1 hypothetical protein [Bacteroidales bacterium]
MSTYIFTFESIHHVLKAEKILLSHSISFEIIPTPQDLSTNCGMVIRFSEVDTGQIKKILKEAGLNFEVFKRQQ